MTKIWYKIDTVILVNWYIYISGCLELVKYAISCPMNVFQALGSNPKLCALEASTPLWITSPCLKQVILSFYFVSEPTPSLGKTKHMDSSTQFLHQWIWRGRGHWFVLLPNSYLIQTLLARDHSLRTWSQRHTRGSEEHTGGPRNTNVTWKTKAQHTGHSMVHPLFFCLLTMIPIKDKV